MQIVQTSKCENLPKKILFSVKYVLKMWEINVTIVKERSN